VIIILADVVENPRSHYFSDLNLINYLKHPVYLRFRIPISLFNRMQFNILKSGLKKTGRGENLTTDLNQPKPNFSITIVPYGECNSIVLSIGMPINIIY